jgi:hypothetical protein
MFFAVLLYLLSLAHTSLAITHNLTFNTTKEGITLSAHIVQPHECFHYFLHNLHAYHLCPILLTITNNTQKVWMLSGNSIEEFSLVPPHIITKDIIYEHNMTATLTAYGCAIAGWLATIAGFGFLEESLPNFEQTTKYISSAATLVTFMYQAHLFVMRRSALYTQTHEHIMRYGLSGANITIDPHTTVTHVMFLNNKSYLHAPTSEDTFYYLFNVKLYNLYKNVDTITIRVEIPKLIAGHAPHQLSST